MSTPTYRCCHLNRHRLQRCLLHCSRSGASRAWLLDRAHIKCCSFSTKVQAAAPSWQLLLDVARTVHAAGAAYSFQGAAAASAQGVQLQPIALACIDVAVQWDLLEPLRQSLIASNPTAIEAVAGGRRFSFKHKPTGVCVQLTGELGRVVEMDTDRVCISGPGGLIWAQSLYAVRHECRSCRGISDRYQSSSSTSSSTGVAIESRLAEAITARLSELQQELTSSNAQAWRSDDTYGAWVGKFGTPAAAAARIMCDPVQRLFPLHRHMPHSLAGQRIANLMGSHGSKAVTLALLGAHVTVVDIGEGNARYAAELAAAAGVAGRVRYIIADVLHMPEAVLSGGYDLVVMELGVLHYFIDLEPLMAAIAHMLRPQGGRLLLREFHPVSTKLIISKGRKHKVALDQASRGSGSSSGGQGQSGCGYFSQELVAADPAFSKYAASALVHKQTKAAAVSDAAAPPSRMQLRQWTLGEVVSAVACAGLRVVRLSEEQGVKLDDRGLPKLYTLVAERL